jgi:small conductance mechanosensitive channel
MSGDDLTNVLGVGGTLLLVGIAVFAIDRAFKRRGKGLAQRVTGGHLDPVVETRLRFVRRLVEAIVVVVGIATALAQFTDLGRFAATILTSGAILAAVVGFAAQRTLANVIAGIMLAVTQPMRIGDLVAFEDHRGVVEDIRLTHTIIQTGADARVIVPNDKLAQTVVRNDSIVTDTVATEVEIWLAHSSDEIRALEELVARVPEASASIKQVTFEGTVLTVAGPHVPPAERPVREAELRREALQALRAAGLR